MHYQHIFSKYKYPFTRSIFKHLQTNAKLLLNIWYYCPYLYVISSLHLTPEYDIPIYIYIFKSSDTQWIENHFPSKMWITMKYSCKYYTNRVVLIYVEAITHLPRTKWPPLRQTTISNAFSCMKIIEFRFQFHWHLFPGGPIDNKPALVQLMAWRRLGDKSLSEPALTLFTEAYMRH